MVCDPIVLIMHFDAITSNDAEAAINKAASAVLPSLQRINPVGCADTVFFAISECDRPTLYGKKHDLLWQGSSWIFMGYALE